MQRKIFLIIIFLQILNSCRKEEHPVPYVPVNIILYGSDPHFVDINAIGGSTYLAGGSRGIIVYRKTLEEFNAFDRHCTFDAANPCGIITIDNTGGFSVTDSCCMSKFLLTDGTVQKGPATVPLRQYQANWDGVKLIISN